ncbi:MAG: TetR/AcrR family transcriptional regulator [Pseudomonadota bacterium]
MKTRDKILRKSLELFNEQGERRVTTNHIAAALGISPGNLYYHFRNKEEIIFELFCSYERETQPLLMAPEDRPLTYADKIGYFEGILGSMWEYRFLHRDLEHLMADNAPLQQRYRQFALQVLAQGQRIYQRLAESGLIEARPDEVTALIVNIWIIVTSWIPFLLTSGMFGQAETISHDLVKRGIYQILLLEAPYLRGEALEKLPEMKARYGG